jgi:hypothetical protein
VQKHLCVHERKLGYILKFLSGVCMSGSRAFFFFWLCHYSSMLCRMCASPGDHDSFFSGYVDIVTCLVICVILQVTMTALFLLL